jgi:hypothetical protein
MDLNQSKLSKIEWKSIEVPPSESEKKILQLIIEGYHNVNIRKNDTHSLLSYMKVEYSPEIEFQLYKQYFEKDIDSTVSKYAPDLITMTSEKSKQKKTIKTRDLIRIKSMDEKMDSSKSSIFEFLMVQFCKEILKSLHEKTKKYAFYLYTLIQLKKSTIPLLNKYVVDFMNAVLEKAAGLLKIQEVLTQSQEFIEKNQYLLKYEDRTLFQHQKQLFSILRNSATPKLVLYIAPTGTGKTLSPLGLSEKHRIIFVCASRHVGLALAKSAIAVGKRVAFAFGCETASDIRLHYFAASEYSRNKKSGGIGKVDNSVGDKVEIMISDVKSYLVSMHYMLAFCQEEEENDDGDVKDPSEDLITYWDEPTITMDYDSHELHETIHRNWVENKISKMVLSCATLPKEEEIIDTIASFRDKFAGAEIHNIVSYDCRKSIAVLNKTGHVVLPHFLFRDYASLQKCVEHTDKNKTLLRYFDLSEVAKFVDCIHRNNYIADQYKADAYFADSISEITMSSLKLYYLEVLRRVSADSWSAIFDDLQEKRTMRFGKKTIRKISSMGFQETKASQPLSRTQSLAFVDTKAQLVTKSSAASSGILLTTEDASTLTDGPAIFLVDDIEKVGKFYIQQTNIPERVFQVVSEKIGKNNDIQGRIDELTKALEDKAGNELDKEKKVERDQMSPEIKRIMNQITAVRAEIRAVTLDGAYIPNTKQHQNIWAQDGIMVENAFAPSVDEESVCDIMALDVSNNMKLLLLLGIGMFTKMDKASETPGTLAYLDIMKRLAHQQQLFLILASSDYIYGTNYQFCHGFIGKDLTNMTQQKTIQAMGRIGRNQIQQEYTIRFRDDAMLEQLFSEPESNKEAEVMCRLFSG